MYCTVDGFLCPCSPRRLRSSRVEANRIRWQWWCLGLGQAEIRDTADAICERVCVCALVCVCEGVWRIKLGEVLIGHALVGFPIVGFFLSVVCGPSPC